MISNSKDRNLFPAHEILNGTTYFAITLGADEHGKTWSETQTYFTGWADDSFRVEFRKIRPVDPERISAYWTTFRQPFYVVNDDRGFVRWMLDGGHALITEEQTKKHLPDEMEDRPTVKEGFLGFTDLKKLPKTAFQKAPTPKTRMAVLKRDKYRCMICGQRPADDVNIQLQIHHIRPFSNRGVTIEKNLITLCHTCHGGLKPHFEYSLFDLIEKDFQDDDGKLKGRMLRNYISSVRNHRNYVFSLLEGMNDSPTVRRKNKSIT